MHDGQARSGTLLLVDDDPLPLGVLRATLTAERFQTLSAESGAAALALLDQHAHEIDCVLTDLYMPGVSGMDVLMYVRERWPEISVIVLTGRADVQTAVSAIRAGAYDYLVKPVDTGEALPTVLRRAIEHHRLLTRNRYLEQKLDAAERFGGLIGNCRPMRQVYSSVSHVASTDATVLVLGESGTGKELVARSVHEQSARAGRAFVAINCGALTETLLESELFGHERGAFTGAVARRHGLFEEASGGTLFLDEVGELSPATQVRLLRVLQERHVRPVGSNRSVPIDVRVIAATNRNLEEEVAARRFREDLFYRLNVVAVELPPLRARGDDVLLLAHHFLAKHAARHQKAVTGIAPAALDLLMTHDWPGNVRELENAIERAVILNRGAQIAIEALPLSLRNGSSLPRSATVNNESLVEARARFERRYLSDALDAASGNLSSAAKQAGMDRSNFRRLLKRYGVGTAAVAEAGNGEPSGDDD
jgi:two-component system response regulator HydG